jgi:hypothetical protein
VHGFAVSMAWGAGIMLAATVPTVLLVGTKSARPDRRATRGGG